jgi:hypothetical protein
VLRSYQLGAQIVADDEWHPVVAALESWTSIASHFGISDYCIPLTLFYKLLASTVGLTELGLRAPVWLFGTAAPLLALLVPLQRGRSTRLVLAWLLAISPLAIYFSRFARPYAIVLVLASAGVLAFFRWWSGGRRRGSVLYVACAILAPYFHLTAAPFVAAPLLFAAGDLLRSRPSRPARSPRAILELAAAIGAGWALLLGPPLLHDWRALVDKAGTGGLEVWAPVATARGVLRLAVGTGQTWLLAALAGVTVLGGASLARRQPRLLVYLGFLGACQLASVLVLRPRAIEAPMVCMRYLVACLPIWLLLTAAGLGTVEGFLKGSLPRWPTGAVPAAACVLLLGFGPLPETYYYPSNWTNHAVHQYEYSGESVFSYVEYTRPERIPRFYEELGRLPAGSLLIVEAPFDRSWGENPFPFYQRIHRQRMKVGFVAPKNFRWSEEVRLIVGEGFRWEHFVHVSDVARLDRDGVAYVVFHRDLWGETQWLGPEHRPRLAPWLEWYRSRFGPPAYEDDRIVAFDVRPPSSRGAQLRPVP